MCDDKGATIALYNIEFYTQNEEEQKKSTKCNKQTKEGCTLRTQLNRTLVQELQRICCSSCCWCLRKWNQAQNSPHINDVGDVFSRKRAKKHILNKGLIISYM